MLRQQPVGDFAQRVTALTQVRAILSQGVATSVIAGVVSLASLVNLIFYGGWLALVALAVVLLAVALNGAANFIQVRRAREAIAVQADLSSVANQALRSIAKLRIAGATERVLAQLIERHADYRRILYGSRLAEAFVRTVNTVTAQVGMLAIYLSVEFLFGYDDLLPGDFVAFSVALGTLNGGVSGLLNAVTSGLMAQVFYERLKPILTAVPERRGDALDPGVLTGRIEVNNVTFRYHEGGPAVLDSIDLAIEPGEFVAIVGGSGSGKSTLLRLLLGFDSPETGSILYDGKDLSKLDLTALRRQFGVVLQNSQPLGGSVRDNVAGSRPLTEDEVWGALEQVGLADDIRAMPMKLETVVSDGSTISGGQRQRVMLARAVAGHPRTIFMDEATSALDNRTQAIVTESLSRLSVTRVVIAHRLSTIRNADKIVVMQNGRLIELGSYDELIAKNGAFAALARRQVL
jgi:ATP-binding cassette subfamily C protein